MTNRRNGTLRQIEFDAEVEASPCPPPEQLVTPKPSAWAKFATRFRGPAQHVATPGQRRRRVMVIAGFAIILAAGAGLVVDQVRSTETAERLAAAPGGVVSLAHPPQEVLRVPISTPSPALSTEDVWLGDWPQVIAVLKDHVIVSDTQAITVVSLVDGATRVPKDGTKSLQCAQDGKGVMCTINDNGPQVLVLDENAAVVTDKKLPGDGWAWPGTGGHVAVLTDNVDRTVTVRWLDASSGATVWEQTTPAQQIEPTSRDESTETFLTSSGASITCPVDDALPRAYAFVIGAVLDIGYCPFSTMYNTKGEILVPPSLSSWPSVLAPPVNVVLVTGESPDLNTVTKVMDPITKDTRRIEGNIQQPAATDGLGWDGVLANAPGKLVAYDPHWEQVWSKDMLGDTGFLAAVENHIVVANVTDQSVISLSPYNGRTQWTAAIDGLDTLSPSAFTDGHVVVLTSGGWYGSDDDGANFQLTALDVSSGRTVWRASIPDMHYLRAANGRLVGMSTNNELVVFD